MVPGSPPPVRRCSRATMAVLDAVRALAHCEYVVGDGLAMTLRVLAMARLCCSET